MKNLDPEKLASMPTEKLTSVVDDLQEDLLAMEARPTFRQYMELKEQQDVCADVLRSRAKESGGFNSKFFQFQQINVEKTDWKAVCRHLVETKKVASTDMEGAITAFTEVKPQGKMLKMKPKDMSLKLS